MGSTCKSGKEGVEDDVRSGGPREATADENVEVVKGGETCKANLWSGHKFWVSTINPNRHLRYVKGLGKMGATNVDR